MGFHADLSDLIPSMLLRFLGFAVSGTSINFFWGAWVESFGVH